MTYPRLLATLHHCVVGVSVACHENAQLSFTGVSAVKSLEDSLTLHLPEVIHSISL